MLHVLGEHHELCLEALVGVAHPAQFVDEQVHDVVLLLGLEDRHEFFFAVGGLAHHRVEDRLFEFGVDVEFEDRLLRNALLFAVLVRLFELLEHPLHALVVVLQHRDRIGLPGLRHLHLLACSHRLLTTPRSLLLDGDCTARERALCAAVCG